MNHDKPTLGELIGYTLILVEETISLCKSPRTHEHNARLRARAEEVKVLAHKFLCSLDLYNPRDVQQLTQNSGTQTAPQPRKNLHPDPPTPKQTSDLPQHHQKETS
jgi:hypothetical protein